MREAYAAIGQPFVIRLYPAERALVEANNGSADASLHRSERVEEKFPHLVRIPVPINMVDVVTVVRRPDLQLRSWASLKPYRLGVVRGIVLYERRTARMHVTKVQYDEELLAMLANDRIDAAVFDRSDALRFLNRPAYRGLRISEPSLEQRPLYHYVNREHAALIPRLQKALEQMQREGRIKAIRDEVIAILKRGGELPPFPMVKNPQEEQTR
jgi:polar amino acid transport system substrate-binding protein